MSVVLFFMPQGQVVGKKESVSNCGKIFRISNPVLVIAQQNGINLVPFLHLAEEKEIVVNIDEMAFNQFFTPVTELKNHYNNLFGSGIVIAGADTLNL